MQVAAFPGLYASRRNGCAIPSRGYAAHGSPIENESISFELTLQGSDADAQAVTVCEPGETYTLTVTTSEGACIEVQYVILGP